MDEQIKAKWVAALRSGEYRQGEGHLHHRKEDAYCCLGVLCKVMGAEWGPATELVFDDDEPGSRSYDHVPVLGGLVLSHKDDEELRRSFLDKVGIRDQSVLIKLNDGDGNPGDPGYTPSKPFSEIADFIEQNL